MVRPMPGMMAMARRPARAAVSDLAPGESAYVAPAALIVTADRLCHIQTDALIRRAPDDMATMHLTRTTEGYIADVTYCHFQWMPTDAMNHLPHAPVVHVIFGDAFLQ
ncbi:MAG: hypothetical protein LC793_17350 [Thermomicrobia bacterium]|nr:hypothetical protein [Thermomicrobia bacterium]MCA1724974.1 hypothetical protein [Thermomicrobia bacterium]